MCAICMRAPAWEEEIKDRDASSTQVGRLTPNGMEVSTWRRVKSKRARFLSLLAHLQSHYVAVLSAIDLTVKVNSPSASFAAIWTWAAFFTWYVGFHYATWQLVV